MNVLRTPYQAKVYRIPPKDFSPRVEVAACYLQYQSRYLVLHRAPGYPQENTWGLPAGKIENNESPRAAVIREVSEETGICLDDRHLKEMGALYVRYPHVDFVYYMFTKTIQEPVVVQLSCEHKDFLWVKLEEFFKLPLISGGREAMIHFQSLSQVSLLPRKSFYFVRHGETDVNANPNIDRVSYDLPLNERGRGQAVFARDIAKSIPFKKVRCSPLQRAQETRDLILNGLDIDCSTDERFSECTPLVWMNMIKFEEGAGYENCTDVQGFLSQVSSGLASSLIDDETTFVVAHGGVHYAICYLLSIERHPWKIGNCEIVHFEPDGDEWKAKVIS